MAEKAGYSPSEVMLISQAALFHDVGKSAVPRSILDKPAALTPEEYEIVKTHTAIGCKDIAGAIQILTVAAIIAHQHHEYVDGSNGYYRLAGDSISHYARLVAVADVCDALFSKRPYREAPWSADAIKEYFIARSGKQFDGEMVKLLLSVLNDVQALYNEKG
jgi:HD-GYP domain-containing protein (c-di-GMP phosphodiesterase class II)